jgi:hypothetical protein
LAYVACHFFDVPVDHRQWKAWLAVYGAVIAGGVAHILVGLIKEVRGAKPSALVGVDDGVAWTQVHESQMLIGLLLLWVGAIGLAVTTNTLNAASAFFVGYSIDSVGDIFLQRFAGVAQAQLTALKATLA